MPCAARAGGTAWRLSGGEISSSLWQAPEARRSPIHSIHAARPLLSGPEGRAAPAGAPAGAPLGQLRGRVGCVWAEGILTLRRRVLVVMYLVELARLIPQHLACACAVRVAVHCVMIAAGVAAAAAAAAAAATATATAAAMPRAWTWKNS
eukprot:scaffold118063_cov45-Phaeocystis_antarctica.AAC.1